MSYNSQLKMRCNILELTQTMNEETGLAQEAWSVKSGGANVRCFLDLTNYRAGRDPIATPDSGTAQNRNGTLFLEATANALPGNRIQIVPGTGPQGTFVIDTAIDEAWSPRKLHHYEMHVIEVDRVFAGG